MAPSRPRDRQGFEIALICALPLEAGWVEAVFDKFWEDDGGEFEKVDGDKNTYTTGVIGEDNVVLAHLPGMGKISAAAVASSLGISFPEIKLAIVVGICGGVPKDSDGNEIILGDVIVSQNLVQYDFGRQYPTAFERKDTLEDALGRSSPEIRGMLAKLKTPRGRQKLQEDLAAYLLSLREKHPKSRRPKTRTDKLYESSYLHKHHELTDSAKLICECSEDGQACVDSQRRSCNELGCDQSKLVHRERLPDSVDAAEERKDSVVPDIEPVVHFGKIGSGDTVMKSGHIRDRLAQADDLVAFEMEGAGIWEYFPSIVVKGVCDYADSHKNKHWQEYAAATAACLAKALLKRRIKREKMDDSVTKSITFWHVPFDRLSRTVGRQSEIELIQKRLYHHDESRKAAICGLGGVGKSRIAWEVAKQARVSDAPCSVFWIQASSVATFEKDLFDIGRKLQIPGFDSENADRKLLFKQYLEHRVNERWLMILDSADDETIWYTMTDGKPNDTSLLRCIPRLTTGSILVTTRSRRVAANFAGKNTIHLDHLTPEAAAELMGDLLIASTQTAVEACLDLVEQLTYLPLAIVQAAAYMNTKNVIISDYLKLFYNKREDAIIRVLSENFEDESRYEGAQNAIASTWLISFEEIQRHHHQAMEYLSFMCCLDEKNIPQSLLPELSSDQDQIETIGTLIGYSFLARQDQSSLQIPLYSMHRLVRLATRNWLENQGLLRELVEKAIEHVDRLSPVPEYKNREIWKIYLPHVSVLCEANLDPELDCRFNLLFKRGYNAGLEERYMQAVEDFSRVVVWWREKLGERSLKTLRALNELGNALAGQSQYEMAKECCTKACKGFRELLAGDDLLVLKSTSYLASIHCDQGQYKEAELLLLEVYETRRRVRGNDHLETLVSQGDLAWTYWKQARYEKAEQLQLDGLEKCKRLLGDEHPRTLKQMSNLAMTYLSQGRFDEAESLLHNVLKIRRRELGRDHPVTLRSISNLTAIYIDQGRYEEAKCLGLECLETQKRVLGNENARTLISMSHLASVLHHQERHEEAECLELECLKIRKRTLGDENPDTLTSMNNLAITYLAQGRYEEAESLLPNALEIRRRVFGNDHPDTLSTMSNLAWTLKYLDRHTEALDLMSECVKRRQVTIGAQHPDTKTAQEILEDWLEFRTDSGPTQAQDEADTDSVPVSSPVVVQQDHAWWW